MRNIKINTTMKEEAAPDQSIMTTNLIKATKLNLILQASARRHRRVVVAPRPEYCDRSGRH